MKKNNLFYKNKTDNAFSITITIWISINKPLKISRRCLLYNHSVKAYIHFWIRASKIQYKIIYVTTVKAVFAFTF